MAVPSDEALVTRHLAGDATVARILYDRHRDRVYTIVRRLAGNDSTADDWAQEVWFRVFRSLPGFRGDSQFSTWLQRVAMNVGTSALRREIRSSSREVQESFESMPDLVGDDVSIRLTLDAALDRLPAGMRTVLVLHDVEGRKHDEIGAMLGMTASTSRSQLGRARARMRNMLEDKLNDE